MAAASGDPATARGTAAPRDASTPANQGAPHNPNTPRNQGTPRDASTPANQGAPRNPNTPRSQRAPLPPALCVLGMGLIGGSLMRAAAAHLPVFGWSPGEATRRAAGGDGFDVEPTLPQALRRADVGGALVVLAAPVTEFAGLLRAVHDTAPAVQLTDVAGVKAPVAAMVADLAPHTRYIGSHPMTGTAHSGWAAGSADLFAGHAWVTAVQETSDLDTWARVAALALAIGSRVVPAEPDAHDDAAARISHLPHLLALALAQVGRAGGALALSLAAGSFTDGTRVAASRPELIRAMCEGNARPLVHALDEALAALGVARASLASSGSLAKLATAGHEARLVFDSRLDGLTPVTLRGGDMVEQLLAVGAAGGYVTEISCGDDGSADSLTVAAMYPTGD